MFFRHCQWHYPPVALPHQVLGRSARIVCNGSGRTGSSVHKLVMKPETQANNFAVQQLYVLCTSIIVVGFGRAASDRLQGT
jgi:hypothetical protein